MSNSNKRAFRTTWCWRRWIDPEQTEIWTERLRAAAGSSWTLTEVARRSRRLAAIYVACRPEALALQWRWGGQVRPVTVAGCMPQKPSAPLRIGGKFEIVHENAPDGQCHVPPRLQIPHGIAFGSGEHATTLMLLRALARRSLIGCRVLDLGAGSGILALAARLLGAREITGTDIDPDAIRTARQNEKLNFRSPLIRWHCADVRRWRVQSRHDIVLANLFSSILAETASRIVASVAPGGSLWLSGILRHQEREVTAAYRKQGLVLVRSARRGKWVLLQWNKKAKKIPDAKKNR
jgi:ribosomal protein L11 methyltransferase